MSETWFQILILITSIGGLIYWLTARLEARMNQIDARMNQFEARMNQFEVRIDTLYQMFVDLLKGKK